MPGLLLVGLEGCVVGSLWIYSARVLPRICLLITFASTTAIRVGMKLGQGHAEARLGIQTPFLEHLMKGAPQMNGRGNLLCACRKAGEA